MSMTNTSIATIATKVAPSYGLGSDVARSIVRKVLELAADMPKNEEADLAANLARLKLENGKLKKLVAVHERQRDALAVKLLNAKSQPASMGRKAQGRTTVEDEDDE